MHEKYTTKAFVLARRASGEADMVLTLFTFDFGLVQGILTGVRNAKSKFKGFTEPGLFIDTTLVRGKHVWRITDMSVAEQYTVAQTNYGKLLEILLFTKSLVHGEEKNETLFETLMHAFMFLAKRAHSVESLESLLLLVKARVLASLGYGRATSSLISLSGAIHESDILEVSKRKQELKEVIESTLSDTQLIGR